MGSAERAFRTAQEKRSRSIGTALGCESTIQRSDAPTLRRSNAPTLRRSHALTSLTASLALLAGCAVGPDYKRPEATTIPAAYTGATNVVTTDSGATNAWKIAEPQAQIPKGNWWEIFGDAELNDLESQASAANQQLKVAVARFAEARAQMDVTRAGLFPNVSLSGSYTRQRVSANTPSTITGQAHGISATFGR